MPTQGRCHDGSPRCERGRPAKYTPGLPAVGPGQQAWPDRAGGRSPVHHLPCGGHSAVIAPVMVLTALKFGFIEITRSRFIEDPAFRLIEPTQSKDRQASFFDML